MFEEKVKGSMGLNLVGNGVISEGFCKEVRLLFPKSRNSNCLGQGRWEEAEERVFQAE